jgi:branched-chain amino acid transport system permease protein
MDFLFSYLVLALIYVLVGLSTNLLVGIVGIFSISQAAVFGVGAYIFANLTMAATSMPFILALAIAGGACVLLNIVVSLPSLRVSGDYFVVTSFGIQLVASAVFVNWVSGTGGANGLPGIPAPEFFGFALDTPPRYVVVAGLATGLGCLAFWLMMRSPFGRLLRAIREDEIAIAAVGKQVLGAKVAAAALAGGFGGVAGGIFAAFMSFIDPYSFDIDASILLLSMVVIGGTRTLAGSIVGPFVMLALPQILTMIDIPSTMAAPARQFAYGVLLIVFMLYRPQGLVGERL